MGGDIGENFRELIDGESVLQEQVKCQHMSQKFLSWRKDKEHYPENANNKRDIYRIYARELIDLGLTFDFDLRFYQ